MILTQDEISVLGLALDIVGAIFLAKAFMFKRISAIVRESGAYYDYNPLLRKSLIEQTTEARFGTVFLVAGFLCQSIPYMGRLTGRTLCVLSLTILVLAFLTWYMSHIVASRMNRKLDRTQALKEILEAEMAPREFSDRELERLEQLSGIRRLSNENKSQTVARFKDTLQRQPRYDI